MIDIDNPDDLAARGLKRIQIEGDDEEYLMDLEGNIYDLRGNFIGTTDDDANGGGVGADNGIGIGTSSDGGLMGHPHQIVDDDDDMDYE